MSSQKAILADQELEIMKVVWELGRATVRDVYEVLLKRRKIAYTTVMTMMNVLERKKFLKKRRRDRAYVYQAVRPKDQVTRAMVREFVDRVFSGVRSPPARSPCRGPPTVGERSARDQANDPQR